MSDEQLAWFRQRLLTWRDELVHESRSTLEQLRDGGPRDIGDDVDHSSAMEIQTLELRTRDRYRKLIIKIDAALKRIKSGDYGYCEITGEPIGLERLKARPIATLSLFAQEIKEHQERRAHLQRARLNVA